MKEFVSFLKTLKTKVNSPLQALDYALQFYDQDIRVSYHQKERISKMANMVSSAGLVADLGSSWGPLGQILAKDNVHVCCLDNWARIYRELAMPLAQYMGCLDKMSFVVGECHKLPFADARFDLVICGEIIEHVKDARKFVAECSRILKPKGTVLFSTPNAQNPMRFLSFTFDFYSDRRHGHVHEFSPPEMKNMLKSSFLETREIVFFNFDVPPILGFMIRSMPEAFFKLVYRPLNRLLQRIPLLNRVFCAGMIVKCIKVTKS